MQTWTIQIASLRPDDAGASAVTDALRAYFAPHHAEVREHGLESIDDATVKSIDAVVLVIGRDDIATPVNQFVAELEEHGVAVIALLDPAIEAALRPRLTGILIDTTEADLTMVGARLEGMLHRQDEIRRLARELTIARRCHGGLSGEMNRLHEELQLAAVMQRDLLPSSLPEKHGVRSSALWRPCNYVSGDMYAVHPLDDDTIGLFLADCVGHGVPAALMTMLVSRSFTAHVIRDGAIARQPDEVLRRLNVDLVRRAGSSTRFATAAYAVMDCRARTLRIASAGHPPALLFRPDEDVLELESQGPLLGIFAEAEYAATEVAVPANATLLLYSDGFEQAFPEAAATVHDRKKPTAVYREIFRDLAEFDDPDQMIAWMEQRLDGAAGSLHQADDLTMVAMHAPALQTVADDAVERGADASTTAA